MKQEKQWYMKITHADNGYVLEYENQLLGEACDVYRTELIAVQENEMGDEAECARRMLWEVLEHFGVYKGIKIELEKPDDND